jgi:4-amino-4-deoxy-L-arabinose transferase-like glycosyltransferase
MNVPVDAAIRPMHTSRASSRAQTFFVLALALILRLLVVAVVITRYPKGWLFTRGIEMGLLAKSLLTGQGLSSPFGPLTGPTAFIAPAYPIFVAGVFKLFGIDSTPSAIVIMLAHTVAAVLTVWLIMHIARTLFSRRTAFIAGLIWACSPPLLWIPSIFWDTSFATAGFLGFVALVLHWRREPSRVAWLLLGAYAALLSLLNPALLFLLAALLLWLAAQAPPPQRARCLLAAVAFTIVFAPWPIRNARVFHAFIPLRTTVGFELWMGNHPGSDGFLDEFLFPTYNRAEFNQYIQQGELAYTHNKSTIAETYIRQHPSTFAALTVRRVFRYWTGTGSKNGSALFALHAGFTTLFGLLGLWYLFREKRFAIALLYALPFVLFPLPYYITHAEFRYRLLLDPLLTTLAAFALVKLFASRDTTPPIDAVTENQSRA